MLKKYKYIIFFFIVVISFLPTSQYVLAGTTEINYPFLGLGTPTITSTQIPLERYIQYVFWFMVITAGIIAVISIVISALQILVSAGSSQAVSSARERIFNAILGIILLMFSFILLRTLNPSLVNPRTTALPLATGLYYRGCNEPCTFGMGTIDDAHPDGYIYQPAPDAVRDTRNVPAGFTDLIYNCEPPGPDILVWLYNLPNWEIDRVENARGDPDRTQESFNVRTDSVPCGYLSSLGNFTTIKSYFWDYKDTGVYYYLTNNCTGIATCNGYDNCAQQDSDDKGNIDKRYDLDQTVRSIRIINEDGPEFIKNGGYGVVLNKEWDFKGQCSIPYTNWFLGDPDSDWTSNLNCYSVLPEPSLPGVTGPEPEFNPYSAHIIRLAIWYPVNSNITLYSKNLKKNLTDTDMGGAWYTYCNRHPSTPPGSLLCEGLDPVTHRIPTGADGNPDLLLRELPIESFRSPAVIPTSECTSADPDGVCLNYIKAEGRFNVILYASKEGSRDASCRIYSDGLQADKPGADDKAEFEELLQGGKNLYRMDIIHYPY